MTAEEIVYTRLAADATLTDLIGTNLYPSTPTENTQLPLLVYTVTSTTPEVHTQGSAGLTRHDVQLDAWAINTDDVLAILDAVKNSLHCWSSADVQGCFMNGRSTDEQDVGQHGVATFSLWVRG